MHVVDVSNTESVAAFCTAFTAAHERLDVLVNNAGVLLSAYPCAFALAPI